MSYQRKPIADGADELVCAGAFFYLYERERGASGMSTA